MAAATMHRLETFDAGELASVLRGWRAEGSRVAALALLPEAEGRGIERLQVAARAEGVKLFGAVFPALVDGERFATSGAWLLRIDDLAAGALVPDLENVPGRVPGAADAIAAVVRPHLGAERTTLLLLVDAMYPRVASLVDELHLRLGNRVQYAGASAGSESFRPVPCLFDGARTLGGGALALLLRGNRGAVPEHGYRVPGRVASATSTSGNRIIEIDGRPAFDVYQALARQQYGVEIDRESFYRLAVHFPFGIMRANGGVVVRIPVALQADGSLFCVGEVPPGAVLALLQAPSVDSAGTVETLARGLTQLAGPLAARELLLFYCAGRRLHLGVDAAAQELAALQRRSGAARLAGALSLGEIGCASAWDYPLFHNAALLGTVWDRP